jgi:CheY-like chemotaxis protein
VVHGPAQKGARSDGRDRSRGGTVVTVRRVLVVDDDDMLREVARVSLEMVGGWEVLTAGSGAEAQVVAVRERPDALLLDVMMPGMDGPSTVVALREDPATRDIPVIFLTAKVGGEGHAQWEHLAVAGVIPKPFDPMGLPGEVARLLGW